MPLKGNFAALTLGLGCSHAFAKKIIQGVADGKTVQELAGRKIRKDSVASTDILARLKDFLEDGDNSRACPGHETVSVAYGQHRPKHLLKESKVTLAKRFLEQNQDCTVGLRVLLRE